jgi:hypothetical protein
MVQSNIATVCLIPPYETTAKIVAARGFAGIKRTLLKQRPDTAAQHIKRPG